jgi:hypothetical protein
MSELNREQVIRNLERLVDKYGENGSYNTYCTLSDSLALIKELIEENERLRFVSAHICVGEVITPEQMEELRMAPGHSDPVGESGVATIEVVRCRDCKHCHHRTIPNNERYECEYYGCSDEVVDYVEPEHYCSYGERRESNG